MRQGDSEDAMVGSDSRLGWYSRQGEITSRQGPEEAADPFRSRAVILGGDLAGDS